MIVCVGSFAAADVVAAAARMGSGVDADHDGSQLVHPNGWGAVWHDPTADGGLRAYRDLSPIYESPAGSEPTLARTRVLAVHARHATLERTQGLRFTHPLARHENGFSWYFMHNGFLPGVHRLMRRPHSEFDSAEYFDYLIPAGATVLDEQETLAKLDRMADSGTSGNAIAVTRDDVYVIHWSSPATSTPRYFQMYRATLPQLTVVASQRLPQFAPAHQWEPLAQPSFVRLSVNVAERG
jgi:glutamine amidotransferase